MALDAYFASVDPAVPDPFASPEATVASRLCLLHQPAGTPVARVLHIPAFGEEMNKSRRMVALQSRALADAGCAVMQFDLMGCGDSAGDHADATWDRWCEDVVWAARHLCDRIPEGGPLWLWGHRVGALLACAAAHRLSVTGGTPPHLLFWQPVSNGKTALQQFLRLKAAAEILAGGGKGVTEALKARLAAGETVEVAGYGIHPELAAGLSEATLSPPSPSSPALPPTSPAGRSVWFDVQPAPTEASRSGPAPALQLAAERFRNAGWEVTVETVTGPQFWQTTEIEVAPGLIERTTWAITAGQSGVVVNPQPPNIARAAPALPSHAVPPASLPSVPREHALLIGGLATAGIGPLMAVLHTPPPAPEPSGRPADIGVVVVVGGPQYRAGSHRQFVHLARHLSAEGFPVLRFDAEGMGDSPGPARPFEELDDSIAAAVDALVREVPTVRRVVLWGLCDGASAALLYLDTHADPRIAGLALANPWVRSAATQARTQVRHYYLQRLAHRSFWAKLLRGGVSPRGLLELGQAVRASRQAGAGAAPPDPAAGPSEAFPARMARAWQRFGGPLLLMLSGNDLTAREFEETARTSPAWTGTLAKPLVRRVDLSAADHTFSASEHRDGVARCTSDLLLRLRSEGLAALDTGR